MAAAFTLAALAAATAGSACLYLGSPRQQWLSRPWPARPARAVSAVLLALAWLAWCAVMTPVTAFFTGLTVCMVLLSVLPAAAALLSPLRRAKP